MTVWHNNSVKTNRRPPLRSVPDGNSSAPFTLHRLCRRRSLSLVIFKIAPAMENCTQSCWNSRDGI